MAEETTEIWELTPEDEKREAEAGVLLHKILGSEEKKEAVTVPRTSLCL